MQKFTRALTREVEVSGERLAVTLDQDGVSIRPVGSRRPPLTLKWSAVLCACAGQAAAGDPSPDAVTAALEATRGGGTGPSASTDASDQFDDLLARLDTWIKKHRSGYAEGLRPRAKAGDLKELAKAIGTVPEELKTWLGWHNGQKEDTLGALMQSWQMLGAAEIAQEYEERKEKAGWKKGWIPFLTDGQSNLVCLDTEEDGHPVLELWRSRRRRPV